MGLLGWGVWNCIGQFKAIPALLGDSGRGLLCKLFVEDVK